MILIYFLSWIRLKGDLEQLIASMENNAYLGNMGKEDRRYLSSHNAITVDLPAKLKDRSFLTKKKEKNEKELLHYRNLRWSF